MFLRSLTKNFLDYMVSPVYESQDRYQICQDPTHKGPRYSANTLAFAVQKGVSICAAGFQGMPPSGFPTTLEERAEDRSKIKGENQLKFWGRSLVGILMHELHHTVSPSSQFLRTLYSPQNVANGVQF